MSASMEADLMSSSIEELSYPALLPEKNIAVRSVPAKLEPELRIKPAQVTTAKSTQGGPLTIRWANGLEDIRDVADAIPLHSITLYPLERLLLNRDYRLPLSQFGLRYIPEPASGESHMRTTKVVGLPAHTTIGQVLASVHGGPVFSAVMCDTVAVTSPFAAMVLISSKHDICPKNTSGLSLL
ncbi:hypothetical protein N7517_005000 [Penicillium concentricum]|uniref:Uncharacterized protein n=1 Tax=Penicillium concentricum TaxID=293559 RepID=A0A9W9S9A1_9EURO|nr:uncharacterized protein N7517_005000 [Penicillium concentricum]KAJ5372994.1 hypothetical protein N7517_005000 [Penicillium concentricum]